VKRTNQRLSDLGEFRIINEVILPSFSDSGLNSPLGDDCAYLDFPGSADLLLVITTDATPKPLAWELGHHCYDTWGWYSVLINVSDLAAAGASALAFSSSVEAPPDTYVDDLSDFFLGMASACTDIGIANAGGNVRAAPRFESHGTAIGIVPRNQKITRSGCRPGDRIFIIGHCGQFITAYFRARKLGIEKLSDREKTSLVRPQPQLRAMNILREAGVVRAASDNSDGVLGAIWNIAERSECAVELNLDRSFIPDHVAAAAITEGVNPWNLMFFWGDWQVIVAVPFDRLSRFEQLVMRNRIAALPIGQALMGSTAIYGRLNGKRRPMRLLRQENFTATSYNTNVDEQLKYMLQTDLFD
jgi:thiamine-monophosphate kinase